MHKYLLYNVAIVIAGYTQELLFDELPSKEQVKEAVYRTYTEDRVIKDILFTLDNIVPSWFSSTFTETQQRLEHPNSYRNVTLTTLDCNHITSPNPDESFRDYNLKDYHAGDVVLDTNQVPDYPVDGFTTGLLSL